MDTRLKAISMLGTYQTRIWLGYVSEIYLSFCFSFFFDTLELVGDRHGKDMLRTYVGHKWDSFILNLEKKSNT